MAVKTFPMHQGDLLPTIRCQVVENDEVTPVPITGFAFNLHIKKTAGVTTKAGIIIDEPNGIFEFPWAAGETDDAGTFPAEVEVIYPGDKPLTWPEFNINFKAQKD